MKKIYTLVLFSLLVNMASCQNMSSNKQTSEAQATTINNTIGADEFDKKIAATPNVQLIDVRSPEEFAEGHLANAVNININGDDFKERVAKLDKGKTVMVYCRSGGRSSRAAGKMEDMGFTEIYNLDGGITDWQDAGKVVVK